MAENEEQKIRTQIDREFLEAKLVGTKYREYATTAPYAYIVRAHFEEEIWDGVFFSWLSIKGHMQGFHEVEDIKLFATNKAGNIEAMFMVIFRNEEALTSWLENGYTAEETLRAIGVPNENIEVSLKRDLS
jgi:hypothetical protein